MAACIHRRLFQYLNVELYSRRYIIFETEGLSQCERRNSSLSTATILGDRAVVMRGLPFMAEDENELFTLAIAAIHRMQTFDTWSLEFDL